MPRAAWCLRMRERGWGSSVSRAEATRGLSAAGQRAREANGATNSDEPLWMGRAGTGRAPQKAAGESCSALRSAGGGGQSRDRASFHLWLSWVTEVLFSHLPLGLLQRLKGPWKHVMG